MKQTMTCRDLGTGVPSRELPDMSENSARGFDTPARES